MFNVSIGIMAYNEEANIGRLLKAILKQNLTNAYIKEVIVVVSGCTDKTEEIARAFSETDERIKILVQAKREGKASAINLFLANATGEIFILESADTVPAEDTLDTLGKLIAPFEKKNIGMTGARPFPVNSMDTFIGFTVRFMWYLHHKVALSNPKLGELVAFRNIVKKIPEDTAVDEASIEAIIRAAGYELAYVSDAIVDNKGPENVIEFLKQRRRIAAGHKALSKDKGYKVSTNSVLKIAKILLRENPRKIKYIFWAVGAVALEITGRLLGYYDLYVCKKNHSVWDISSTTKKWE